MAKIDPRVTKQTNNTRASALIIDIEDVGSLRWNGIKKSTKGFFITTKYFGRVYLHEFK